MNRISIHAPPRGATSDQEQPSGGNSISVHAPPRGATGCAFFCVPPVPLFQFTPLREGRQQAEKEIIASMLISIHAPPRGATLRFTHYDSSEIEFQFTPLREGRQN